MINRRDLRRGVPSPVPASAPLPAVGYITISPNTLLAVETAMARLETAMRQDLGALIVVLRQLQEVLPANQATSIGLLIGQVTQWQTAWPGALDSILNYLTSAQSTGI